MLIVIHANAVVQAGGWNKVVPITVQCVDVIVGDDATGLIAVHVCVIGIAVFSALKIIRNARRFC